MAIASQPRTHWRLYRRKAFFGLAAVLLFALACRLPAFHYLGSAESRGFATGLESISLFAHSLTAWFTAWALFQVYDLLNHRIFLRGSSAAPLRDPFSTAVLLVAGVFSLVKWFGYLSEFLPISLQRNLTSFELVSALIISTAGFYVFVYVGMMLDRLRSGFGFWLMVLLHAAYFFGASLNTSYLFADADGLSRNVILLSLAIFTAQVLIALSLLLSENRRENRSPKHVFTVTLLTALFAWQVERFVPDKFFLLFPESWGSGPAIFSITMLCLLSVVLVMMGGLKGLQANLDMIAGLALIFAGYEVVYKIAPYFWPRFLPIDFLVLAWIAHELFCLVNFGSGKKPIQALAETDFDADFRRGWR